MLDPKVIRQHMPELKAAFEKRHMEFDVVKLEALEEERKFLQIKTQELQNERNKLSKAVGLLKAQQQNADSVLAQVKVIGEELTSTHCRFEAVQATLQDLLLRIPNIPHISVPDGISEDDNQLIRLVGQPRDLDFKVLDHVSLGEQLGWMDFATAAKLTGARFVILRGPLARLERALIQFMLDIHTEEHGYSEVAVPYLVNQESLYGTGQLPKLVEDLFKVTHQNAWYLIPTAEVPVTNMVRDEILPVEQLPLKYVCHSPCFRSEAGSYGKDVRGMIRQHQFQKVELVQVVHPNHSYQALEELVGHAEVVLQRLELPYRVMALCGADLGFSAAKTYDLEVWLPSQNRYREISSCSNTEAFQARRLKARYRDPNTQKPELVHTLNGSALAVGRTLVAIMENYQDEHGKIHIPRALQPYLQGKDILA